MAKKDIMLYLLYIILVLIQGAIQKRLQHILNAVAFLIVINSIIL